MGMGRPVASRRLSGAEVCTNSMVLAGVCAEILKDSGALNPFMPHSWFVQRVLAFFFLARAHFVGIHRFENP